MARGFSVAAGNGRCSAPIACASLASSPGSETTSARAPASISACGDRERCAPIAARGDGRGDLRDRPARERGVGAASERGKRRRSRAASLRRAGAVEGSPGAGAAGDDSRGETQPHEDRLNVSNEEPKFHSVGEPPNRRRIAFRRRCASAKRQARPRLALRLPLRHGLDQGERARRRRPNGSASASCASTIPATAARTGGSRTARSRSGSRRRWRFFGPRPRARRSCSARRWAAISRCSPRAPSERPASATGSRASF